jgi:tetratricopeptide (TPR) repeat protein
MSENVMLQEAIDAIAQGQYSRARDLLTRLLRTDQDNPTYWLWMSAAVETKKECIFCLKNVLRIDPDNSFAKRGLILLGELPAQDIESSRLVKRQWKVEELAKPLAVASRDRSRFELNVSIARFGLITLFLIFLVYFSLRFVSSKLFIGSLTMVTPKPWTLRPTATLLPTNTPFYHTSTPTFVGPTPLWMMLEATYTPTPLYVNTPHPVSEAYQAGLRSMNVSDYSSMLQFMQQAANIEPNAADLQYYIGEAYRMIGEYDKALEAYEKALSIDKNFAPAYLGRARVRLQIEPTAEIEDDLKQAILLDPTLGEARLEYANYLIRSDRAEEALEELAQVGKLLPDSPLLYLYRAQAYLELGQLPLALEAAIQANEMDITLLSAYRILGEAYLENEEADNAIEVLRIYTSYVEDDPFAWYLLGKSLYLEGQTQEAVEALEYALNLAPESDETAFGAYLYRGLAYINLGEGQKAVNDLFVAKRLHPDSFIVNLEFAHALLLAGRIDDALGQIYNTLKLAENPKQEIEVYFWRAQIFEEMGNKPSAIKDWKSVLDLVTSLPMDEELEKKEQIAKERLSALLPKTATPTPTRIVMKTIVSPTFTLSPKSATPSATAQPTYTPTPTVSISSSTPQPTLTKTP